MHQFVKVSIFVGRFVRMHEYELEWRRWDHHSGFPLQGHARFVDGDPELEASGRQ